jgi:hypothetical protein
VSLDDPTESLDDEEEHEVFTLRRMDTRSKQRKDQMESVNGIQI